MIQMKRFVKFHFFSLCICCSLIVQAQRTAPDDFGQDELINPSALTYAFDIAKGPVEGSDESLIAHYHCPEWFRNAKFGIYMHWGLNTVPGFDGHYARRMYWSREPDASLRKNIILGYRNGATKVYQYHVKHFGHPSRFGYKDFIPLWKATRFDADSLAAFYKEVGARFIGVMAVHHDNFDLYDSKHQPWNSVEMGPKLDIVGAWEKACRKVGVHFAVTSHLSNYCHEHMFYQGSDADADGPYKGVPYDYMNSAYEGLYGKRTPDRILRIEPEFAQQWYERTKELVSKYHPDLLYFDGPLPNGIYGQQLAAHFYNTNFSEEGIQQGVLTIKRPRGGFTLDREAQGVNELQKEPFLVDTSLNPGWFYMGNSLNIGKEGADAGMASVSKVEAKDKLRLTAGQVIDNLVDIVSKNGNMMLNVGLRADGSLPETFREELRKIGRWLKMNGEAIYDTRPFKVYGEGGVSQNRLKFISVKGYNDDKYVYTSSDVRFTTKDGAVYVIVLDWPGNGKTLRVNSLGSGKAGKVRFVALVADGRKLKWKQEKDALCITMPDAPVGEYAYAFKVDFTGNKLK